MNNFPEKFIERLQQIIPLEFYENVYRHLREHRGTVFRNNSLKQSCDLTQEILKKQNISFQVVSFYREAFLLLENIPLDFMKNELVQQAILYKQGLSSMLVPIILDPQKGERILDCCAAPGSKTTQIAALGENQCFIIAVDNIRNRFYKLKNICTLLGAENITFKLLDVRKFRTEQSFDKILVDAPCSSEGRFHLFKKKTYAYWSERKIKEMQRKQRGILLHASRLLRPGGELVYSTCTFAPEENEDVIDWLLRKTGKTLEVQSIEIEGIPSYPCLARWKNKEYDPSIEKCLRILPTKDFEGFFICKIKKVGV